MKAQCKFFLASFPGKFLGGSAVVRATAAEEAQKLVFERCVEECLSDVKKLEDVEVTQLKGDGILDFDNGDY
jgi:hypothetical protein